METQRQRAVAKVLSRADLVLEILRHLPTAERATTVRRARWRAVQYASSDPRQRHPLHEWHRQRPAVRGMPELVCQQSCRKLQSHKVPGLLWHWLQLLRTLNHLEAFAAHPGPICIGPTKVRPKPLAGHNVP